MVGNSPVALLGSVLVDEHGTRARVAIRAMSSHVVTPGMHAIVVAA
jgi:hypothetical protein